MADPSNDAAGSEMFEGELQQLRQKVRLLQADRQFMQEEIQRLQNLGGAADATTNEHEEQSEQLKQQVLATTAELAAARTMNAKLLAKLQLTARALQLQRHALDDIKREVLTSANAAVRDAQCIEERVLQAMQLASQKSTTRIQQLEEQVQQLHAELQQQEADSALKITELHVSRDSALAAVGEVKAKFRVVQGEYANAQEQLQQLQVAMQNLETLRDQLRSEVQQAQSQLAILTARADAAEHRTTELSDAKARATAQLDQQRRSFAELTAQRVEETKQLQEENATQRSRISQLEAAEAELQAQVAKLQGEVANLQQQAELTKSGAETMSQQYAAQISALQTQVRMLEQRAADRDGEFAAQQRQLDCANDSAVEYQLQAQQAKASLGLLEKRYWKLTQDADDIRGKLVTTQSERDRLATSHAQLQSQIMETKAQQRQAAEALQQSREVEADLRRQLQEHEQAGTRTVSALQDAIKRLEAQLSEKDSDLERLQQMVISQCAERNSLLDELSQIRLAMHPTPPTASAPAASNKSGLLSTPDEQETWQQRALLQGSNSRHRHNSRGSKVVPV